MDFGTHSGVAGSVLWRMTGDRLSFWLGGVPASDAAWAKPLAVAVALSLQCETADISLPRDKTMVPTSVSARCLKGTCEPGDFAATYLNQLHLGYVHAPDGTVYLVNPQRDLWVNGHEGPGFYHQVGGADEKLEPGRTN
jgi:hypothetical protein